MSRRLGITLIILTICLLTGPVAAGENKEAASRVAVAKVNGRILYQDQLAPILQARQKHPSHRGSARPENDQLRQRQAVEQLIDVELLAQQARTLDLPGLAEKIEARVNRLRQEQPAMFDEKPEAQIRELVADELRVAAFLQQQGVADPEIAEAEIRSFYDRGQESFRRDETVRLRHVTIQLPTPATTGQRAAAREILGRSRQAILAGAAFDKAVEEVLRDPGGFHGELGLLTRRELPEPIAAAAFALASGTISEVIDTPSGVHLVSVLERTPAGIAPYEEVKDFIRRFLQEGHSRQAYQQLVQNLRRQAKIELLPGPG